MGYLVFVFNYVFVGFLIGSGIGVYFSNVKVFNNLLNRIYLFVILVMVINIGLIFFLNLIFKMIFDFSLVSKILIAVILVMI